MAQTADDAHLPSAGQIRALGERRTRRRRTWTAAAVAAASVLAVASVSVVPRLGDHHPEPATHLKNLTHDGAIPVDTTAQWVASLPAGPDAPAAWVSGDVLHVGSTTVRITGAGIRPSTVVTVRAATPNGWFASVGSRVGVVRPDGHFVAFDYHGSVDTLLVSPDGSQALIGDCCGDSGLLMDTATGRVIMHVPHLQALTWTRDGIYAEAPRGNGFLVWKPGGKVSRSSFDPSRCNHHGLNTGPTVAALEAGYGGCTSPRLVTVSPDGNKALVGKSVVDAATGQRTQFAPSDPFGRYSAYPSYAVLWEDNQHVLFDLETPTVPSAGGPDTTTYMIVRCDVDTGSCQRASNPYTASEPGIALLH